jgi:hypothetical protein
MIESVVVVLAHEARRYIPKMRPGRLNRPDFLADLPRLHAVRFGFHHDPHIHAPAHGGANGRENLAVVKVIDANVQLMPGRVYNLDNGRGSRRLLNIQRHRSFLSTIEEY